jgi:hypothetical protein
MARAFGASEDTRKQIVGHAERLALRMTQYERSHQRHRLLRCQRQVFREPSLGEEIMRILLARFAINNEPAPPANLCGSR